MAQQQSVQMLQARLEYEQKLVQLVDRIHAAKGIDNIFIELQDEILDLLDRLVRDHGKTALMVTHDPLAAERARIVLHLEKGVLVEALSAGRPQSPAPA